MSGFNIIKSSLQKAVVYFLFFAFSVSAQTPLHSGVLVSDVGTQNNIGRANTSRNVAVTTEGDIYVAYTGTMGIRVAKSENRGETFSASVQISTDNSEPEIITNDHGDIFVSWITGGIVYLSKSTDGGITFNTPKNIGSGSGNAVHMAVYNDFIYIIDRLGSNILSNPNRGDGDFLHITRTGYVYADIRTDQNGVVYAPSDDPNLYLFKSENSGVNYTEIDLIPDERVFFSSYALSDGPCGTFIFVGGGGSTSTEGYKIDLDTGATSPITLGDNSGDNRGRTLFADNRGTLVDGYRNGLGELRINVSYDQGQTFSLPILVANGVSHSVTRNPFFEDIDVVYEKNGQVYLNVYDNLLKNIKLTANTFSSLCPGDTFDLPFELSGVFDPNTEFIAYLSDNSGSFVSKIQIGVINTNVNGVVQCTIPNTITFGESYRVILESQENCTQSNTVGAKIGSVQLNDPSVIQACDDNNDGFSSFDTSNVESEVLGNLVNSGFVVEYFDENGDALPSPLPNPYHNLIRNSENITIRVSRPFTSCFTEKTLKLEVLDTPVISQPEILYACDEGNGYSVFDTSGVESQIIGNQTGLIIRYFDQNNNELPSPLPISYQNIEPWNETIHVKVENSINTLCYSETTLSLVVNELPNVDLEENYFYCPLEPSMFLSVDSSLDYWEWVFEKDGEVISNSFEAEFIEEGDYTINFGKIENGILCENTFSFTVTLFDLPVIQELRKIELSDNNSIEIVATGDGDLEYSIDGINFQDSPLFEALQGAVYTAVVRDKGGCGEDSEELVIIDYPKYFTPNNDGNNDIWQIRGIEKFPGAQIRIYDRYGKLLKQISSDPNEGWDGTFNGVALPMSDYWFTAYLDENISITEHFTLRR